MPNLTGRFCAKSTSLQKPASAPSGPTLMAHGAPSGDSLLAFCRGFCDRPWISGLELGECKRDSARRRN